MSRSGKLRLVLGLIVVVVIAGVFTIRLNTSRGTVASLSASIQTQSYTVGSAYAGTVVQQFVALGDPVTKGEALFAIDSPTLRHDIAIGLLNANSFDAGVQPDGTLNVVATGDGTVSKVADGLGTFVQAGSVLATVDRAGSLYVSADLTLTPTQFARLAKNADVSIVLPNEHMLAGNVHTIRVETVEGQAKVVIEVTSPELVANGGGGIVGTGVPVVADVSLRNDGVVTTVADFLGSQWSRVTR
jgi:multidrug resistance efflux pump